MYTLRSTAAPKSWHHTPPLSLQPQILESHTLCPAAAPNPGTTALRHAPKPKTRGTVSAPYALALPTASLSPSRNPLGVVADPLPSTGTGPSSPLERRRWLTACAEPPHRALEAGTWLSPRRRCWCRFDNSPGFFSFSGPADGRGGGVIEGVSS